jgi:hypothetical protein
MAGNINQRKLNVASKWRKLEMAKKWLKMAMAWRRLMKWQSNVGNAKADEISKMASILIINKRNKQ